VILYGGGDHALAVWEILQLLKIPCEGFFDDGEGPFTLPAALHLGPYSPEVLPSTPVLLAMTDNTVRRNLSLRVRHPIAPPVVHPRAYVSASASVGPGAVVLAGAVVHSRARVGAHTIVNTGAVVEHFAEVGSFCHLSPGVIVGCRSRVGGACFVGSGAIIVPKAAVGEGCVIGAGSLVLKDLPPFTRAWGHPARPQSENPSP